MASAQVLSNSVTLSRKQEHLEAGKRRLEEFRKKKAEDRAKKAASTNKLHAAAAGIHERQPLENEQVRFTNSDRAHTSDGVGRAVVGPSDGVINKENKAIELFQNNELSSSYSKQTNPSLSTDYYNSFSAETMKKYVKDQDFNKHHVSEFSGPLDVNCSPQTEGNNNDRFISRRPQAVQDIDGNSSQLRHYELEEVQSRANDNHTNEFTGPDTESSFEAGQTMHDGYSGSLWSSESQSNGFSFDIRSSSNHVSAYPYVSEKGSRRSRPSFLDSIDIPRVSSVSLPLTEPGNTKSFISKVHTVSTALASSASEKSFTETGRAEHLSKLTPGVSSADEHSMNISVSGCNEDVLYRHNVNGNSKEMKHDFYLQKQDEDFASLEQHIEDLTQEKFSLQRALEASRALAESLASENSALTDSYNQQGSVINQLKSDMEKLQEEIKAQLVELESVKIEYTNAQLECNAADERGKLFASEVIGLEEKALRLRSSELKLERQLENAQAEISYLKKKMSSLEKERQDLQSTIDAMQEEKKLLQDKLRKASADGKFTHPGKNPPNKRDMSTSTEDLVCGEFEDSTPDDSNLEMHGTVPPFGTNASSSHLLPENRQFNLDLPCFNVPPDQKRMIENINTLLSELELEKEGLMETLLAESSQCSSLKELNQELSQKLEAQTQRLELLTAQSMANENVPRRQLDTQDTHDNPAYADEGDEVVERVLGWIMKLFPGGPSKRRTSKLL